MRCFLALFYLKTGGHSCVVGDDVYIVPQVCTHSRDAVGSVPYITHILEIGEKLCLIEKLLL